jgi:hypothetical protein
MRYYWLTLGVLGAWRVTHLLQAEDGPWGVVIRLRHFAGWSIWGSLLDCFYCLSLWVALPFALGIGETTKEKALLWLALSAGAILLERLTTRKDRQSPNILFQENDHVLRQQENEFFHQLPEYDRIPSANSGNSSYGHLLPIPGQRSSDRAGTKYRRLLSICRIRFQGRGAHDGPRLSGRRGKYA